MKVKVAQSCPTLQPRGLHSLWNSPGQNTGVCSLSLLQGSSQPRDQTQVSFIASGFFTIWATREALLVKEKDICGAVIEKPCLLPRTPLKGRLAQVSLLCLGDRENSPWWWWRLERITKMEKLKRHLNGIEWQAETSEVKCQKKKTFPLVSHITFVSGKCQNN